MFFDGVNKKIIFIAFLLVCFFFVFWGLMNVVVEGE